MRLFEMCIEVLQSSRFDNPFNEKCFYFAWRGGSTILCRMVFLPESIVVEHNHPDFDTPTFEIEERSLAFIWVQQFLEYTALLEDDPQAAYEMVDHITEYYPEEEAA